MQDATDANARVSLNCGIAAIPVFFDNVSVKEVVVNGVTEKNNSLPSQFSLGQNYPNPFNPETTIEYEIPSFGFISLKVFDVLGKEISSIQNGYQFPGKYQYRFSTVANQIPSGVYFYSLTSGSFSSTKRMVVIK